MKKGQKLLCDRLTKSSLDLRLCGGGIVAYIAFRKKRVSQTRAGCCQTGFDLTAMINTKIKINISYKTRVYAYIHFKTI